MKKETLQIVVIAVWNTSVSYKIFWTYSSPRNNKLNLDSLMLTSTILASDFNSATPNWNYAYHKNVAETVKAFVEFDDLAVFCFKKDPKSFLHHSNSSITPYLDMTLTKMLAYCLKSVIGNPGTCHRMIAYLWETASTHPHLRPAWNFKNGY